MPDDYEEPITVPYVYLRSVELEGRHPEDCGSWGVTAMRVWFGEGELSPRDPFKHVKVSQDGLLPAVPRIPTHRLHPEIIVGYRRILSSLSAERYLRKGLASGIKVSLPLSLGWVNPQLGVIPTPHQTHLYYDKTHAVQITAAQQSNRHLDFNNWWGINWGNRGRGSLPYEYFDRYVFESYVRDFKHETAIESSKSTSLPSMNGVTPLSLKRIVTRTEEDDRHYGFTVEESAKNRMAWAFVRESRHSLDLEEFYVRPEFRRRGLSAILRRAIDELRARKQRPLRVFIPWPESQREDENAYELMCKVISQLGCTFQKCTDPRAAYMAIEGTDGNYYPDPPDPYPERPRGPLLELMIAAAMTIINLNLSTTSAPMTSSTLSPATYSQSDMETIRAALKEVNVYRHLLIKKRAYIGISQREDMELARLQEQAKLFADQLAPIDTSMSSALAPFVSRLGSQP